MRARYKAAGVITGAIAMTSALLAGQLTGLWTLAGQNTDNSRFQSAETKIGISNASNLSPKWSITTEADVSATPAVDGTTVYFPDWAGNIYAVDRDTGMTRWQTDVTSITGLPAATDSGIGAIVRATPAVAGNLLLMGDQGGRVGAGASVFALDRRTGQVVWKTQVQGNGADPTDASSGAQFAIITQPVMVDANNPTVAYVGTASWEEAVVAFAPGYPCCTFRGMVVALNTQTGAVLWRTYTTPVGYSGAGVWGSTASLDASRKTMYVTTGNNYSVPAAVGSCIAAAAAGAAQSACLDPGDHVDSVLALDINTGKIKWAMRAVPFDTWNVACIFNQYNPAGCPPAAQTGPDFDFAQGPILFTAKVGGKSRSLVGAGQKSGAYWALDRDTGAVVWKTEVGPGGTLGGLQWGSAYDGKRIYVAVNNNFGIPWGSGAAKTTNGGWVALDPSTGAVLWETATSDSAAGFGGAAGPVSVANGVVYACSFTGTYTALNAATGATLWKYDSGRTSCAAGAAISQGNVFWGTGYNQIQFAPTAPAQFNAFGVQ